jgi:hypothetical protein
MERMSVEQFNKISKKGNKYHNEKTMFAGERYDSKKEADYAQHLETLRHAKETKERVTGIKRQVEYPIDIDGKHICSYYADFVVSYKDGHHEVVDVKGYRTEVYKLKKKLVEAIYKIKIIEK